MKISANLKVTPSFMFSDLSPDDIEALIAALTFYTLHAKDAPKRKATRAKEILHALEQSDAEAFSELRKQNLTILMQDKVV